MEDRYTDVVISLYISKTFGVMIENRHLVTEYQNKLYNDERTVEKAVLESGRLPTQADVPEGWSLTDYADYIYLDYPEIMLGEINQVSVIIELTRDDEIYDYWNYYHKGDFEWHALERAAKDQIDLSDIILPDGWKIINSDVNFK